MCSLSPDVSERDFQKAVVDMAHTFGWRIAHFRTSMNARGKYQTAVGADGKGWPDLVLVHPTGGVLFRELKARKGVLDPAQAEWGERLTAAGGDWAVWRPADMDAIASALSFGRATVMA